MVVYLLGISKSEFQYQVLINEEEGEPDCKKLLGDEESQEVECCPNERFSMFLKYSQPAAFVSLICLICINLFPLALPATVVR